MSNKTNMNNSTKLYPLKFDSIFLEKIWGGHKIKSVLNKDFGNLVNCGESWELSGVNNAISVVKNGPLQGHSLTNLMKIYGSDLVGSQNTSLKDFPLLIKYIDANKDLSVQVHPNDKIALKRHNSFGKTEMWYVVNADENTKLISGFNKNTGPDEFKDKLNNGTITEILNEETVKQGDVFFLPAGRIHTIGKGSLILEIQQTSDITYRVYDFDRVGLNGKKRDLHIEQAIDVLDYKLHKNYKSTYDNTAINTRITLVNCDYFQVNKININRSLKLNAPNKNSFTAYISTKGNVLLKCNEQAYTITENELILIPAALTEYTIEPKNKEASIMEVYVP